MSMYRQLRPQAPARRAKRHRGRLLSLLIVILFGGYLAWASLVVPRHALAGSITAEPPQLAAESINLPWPSEGQAALGAAGDGVLATKNTQAPLPTASVTKLITALCVLKQHPIAPGESGPTITLNQADVDSYNYYLAHHGSLVMVRAGQQLSERQALEAMLLRSANNMADTVARWSYGSLPAYAAAANAYVASQGLKNTHIGTDASGFDPSTTSTASDLVRLGELVMQQPVLRQIVGEKSANIPEDGTIHNTNNLLGQHGIIGIKTGNNDQDPGAFLLAAKYQSGSHTITIIDAVMGAPNISAAKQTAVKLLLASQRYFRTRTVVSRGDTVGNYIVPWAAPVAITARHELTVFGWAGSTVTTKITLRNTGGSIASGQQVGSIRAGTASAPIGLTAAVPAPPLRWRLTHPLQ